MGEHILESRKRDPWQRMVSIEAQKQWVEQNVPQMLADDPGASSPPPPLPAVRPAVQAPTTLPSGDQSAPPPAAGQSAPATPDQGTPQPQ